MGRINRDVVVAVVLLAACGVMFHASFDIEETSYGTLSSRVWPQVLLGALAVFALGLLAQALARGTEGGERAAGGGLAAWLGRYANALWCFGLFLAFLLTLPVFGMLLGGALFVFAVLSILGPPGWGKLPAHAAVAVISVGAMWAIFTFWLRVFLPEGMILSFY